MNTRIVSILGGDEKSLEYYFDIFLTNFHRGDEEKGRLIPSRKFIKTVGASMLQISAKEAAHSIIAMHQGDINNHRLLFSLSQKINQYFIEYRREYLTKFHILINNLLG